MCVNICDKCISFHYIKLLINIEGMNNTKIKINDDPLQTVLSPLGSFRKVCFLANYFYSLMWFSVLQQANATEPKARGVGAC